MKLMKNLNGLFGLIEQIKESRGHHEPTDISFSITVGSTGVGKTTFAQRAYYRKDVYSKYVFPEVNHAVDECLQKNLNVRIDCGLFPKDGCSRNADASFGTMLLYETLKHQLK